MNLFLITMVSQKARSSNAIAVPESPAIPSVASAPSFDLDTATRFLEALDRGHGKGFCFQTFPGNHFSGSWGPLSDKVAQLNKDKGVFVTVSATDGKGRKKTNCTAPRALFLDFDGVQPDAKLLKQLPPVSATVQSRNGKHLYWFLQPGEPLGDLEPALTGLIGFMGADPACKDMSRMMRVPGSVHHKAEPWQTVLIELYPDRRYSIAEVMQRVPASPVNNKPKRLPKQPKPSPVLGRPTESVSLNNIGPRLRKVPKAQQLPWLLSAMAEATEGGRNALLNWIAYEVYRLTAAGVPQEYLEEALTGAAIESGLTQVEATGTIDSAFIAAAADGKGLTRSQKMWRDFERLWGPDSYFNVRDNEAQQAGKPLNYQEAREAFTAHCNKDIEQRRFDSELTSWLESHREHDPIEAYFDGLTVPTVTEAWATIEGLAATMGLKDSHEKMVLARWLTGCVKRTYEPGAMFDWCLVLKGNGGSGKSSFFANLAPVPDAHQTLRAIGANGIDKDDLMKAHKGLMLEIEELDKATRGNDLSALKSLISPAQDSYRVPYAGAVKPHPRRFGIGATVNLSNPLTDDGAGLRRYIVLEVPGGEDEGSTRQAYYSKNREAIWAAAKALYQDGYGCLLTAAERQVEKNRKEDNVDRSGPYARVLEMSPLWAGHFFGPEEALKPGAKGLHLDDIGSLVCPDNPELRGGSKKADVLKALREAGWDNPRVKVSGARVRLWLPAYYPSEQVSGRVSDKQVRHLAT